MKIPGLHMACLSCNLHLCLFFFCFFWFPLPPGLRRPFVRSREAMSCDKVKRGLHGCDFFLMYLDSLIELVPCLIVTEQTISRSSRLEAVLCLSILLFHLGVR